MAKIYLNTEGMSSNELSVLSIVGMIKGDPEHSDRWYTEIPDFKKLSVLINRHCEVRKNAVTGEKELHFV